MRKDNRIFVVVIMLLIMGIALLWAGKAWSAEVIPDSAEICEAIKKAEGNPNYGILGKIKGNDYAKACRQTADHAKRDYPKEGLDGQDFISFLGSRYAPIGVSNDPKNLNKNWIGNVKYFLWNK